MKTGITLRALLISFVSVILGSLWTRQSELLSATCAISESVPTMHGMAILIFLAVLYPVINMVGKKYNFSRGELITIYIFTTIGCVMAGTGIIQALLPYLAVPRYFATPDNGFLDIIDKLPSWLSLQDMDVINQFFEGSPGGAVPWKHWIKPLSLWLLFFVVYWWVIMCVWIILRKQWVENERLTFPLTTIPLYLTDAAATPEQGLDPDKTPPFLKNPLMWIGFCFAGGYQILLMLHAVNPDFPAVVYSYPMGKFFTEYPLKSISSTAMIFKWDIVGLGYLISTEILFSVWFFYWVNNILTVILTATGSVAGGKVFPEAQAIGGNIAMVLIILYVSRKHLAAVLKNVFTKTKAIDDTTEPFTYRIAVLGGLTGFIALILFCAAAGMPLWLSACFFGFILCFVIVYGRIRAETGTPAVWLFLHSQIKYAPIDTFGSAFFIPGGDIQGVSVMTNFHFLIHGGFLNQASIYQLEAFQLGDKAGGISRKGIALLGLGAVAFGFIVGVMMYLPTAYEFGAQHLANFSGRIDNIRVGYCLQAWNDTAAYIKTPLPPKTGQITAEAAGFITTLSLFGIRNFLMINIPLNPLGYILAATRGYFYWWAFFLAWLAKLIILRIGGVQLYRKLIPMFIGMVIGYYFFSGIVWSIVSSLLPALRITIGF
ncbi:MAG: DUF6785 family protein [Elusimicrobiota bacterium]